MAEFDDDRDDPDEPDHLEILRLVAAADQSRARQDDINRRIAAVAARGARLSRRMAVEGESPRLTRAWESLLRAERAIARRQAALASELDATQARIDALANRLGVDLTQSGSDYIDE